MDVRESESVRCRGTALAMVWMMKKTRTAKNALAHFAPLLIVVDELLVLEYRQGSMGLMVVRRGNIMVTCPF